MWLQCLPAQAWTPAHPLKPSRCILYWCEINQIRKKIIIPRKHITIRNTFILKFTKTKYAHVCMYQCHSRNWRNVTNKSQCQLFSICTLANRNVTNMSQCHLFSICNWVNEIVINMPQCHLFSICQLANINVTNMSQCPLFSVCQLANQMSQPLSCACPILRVWFLQMAAFSKKKNRENTDQLLHIKELPPLPPPQEVHVSRLQKLCTAETT